MKNQAFKVFIVEDDTWYGSMLQHYLSLNPEYEIKRFESPNDFFAQLHQNPDVVTLDYSLPDYDGAEVLKKIKETNPDVRVIIISGQEDVATAINLLKNGAFDYIVKDDETKDRLWNSILHLREISDLKQEVETLKTQVGRKYDFSEMIIGKSDAIKKVFAMIEKAANTNITVSISGETGSGKEMVAKAIHYNSARHKLPFVTVNVAAIPKDLIESELFGHEKGAFTGAETRRIGRFEQADKGTIFLDEIGDMTLGTQVKLMRVLQEKSLQRLGGKETIPVDVRVVAATNRDLESAIREKQFREDLYYRLSVVVISLPPLRNRREDVPDLVNYFLQKYGPELGNNSPSIHPEALEFLQMQSWPGNVRELENAVRKALLLAQNYTINLDHVRNVLSKSASPGQVSGQSLTEYADDL